MSEIIQIAGIIDRDEAGLLAACGVTHLGFPLQLAVHREDLIDEEAASIIRALPPDLKAVLITYLAEAGALVSLSRALGAHIVQIHGDIPLRELILLKTVAPELGVIKSLVVRAGNLSDLEETVRELGPYVDAFITDTFDPATGASGATGKTHDWRVSRRLVEISTKPVILAGGLDPENVRDAILETGPAGVDAHTGVEDADGRKSREKVSTFVREARDAFCLLGERGVG